MIFRHLNNNVPIEGWFLSGNKADKYDIGIDDEVFFIGNSSAYLMSKEDKIQGFGTLMQKCSAKKYFDKRIKMTGYIKSEQVNSWAGMWLRIDSRSGTTISIDNMQDRVITGDEDWKKCEIVLDVPQESESLNYGVLLTGTGKIWFDKVSFEVVDKNMIPTTSNIIHSSHHPVLPEKPANVDFEN